MEFRKGSLLSFILVVIAAFVVFFVMHINTDHYNLTYIFNFFSGGLIGCTIVKGIRKIIFFYLFVIIIVIIINQFFITGFANINYFSIILIVAGFFFGRYIENKLEGSN
ncbi:hypothetical protein WAK64_09950 [Bacillus spongiae]|uniref:TIGR04086 family membrane protein n=1 Tax=Bacillus spongiae TaxID=2683610 RepID=A0ABU8HDW6_9BACI